MLGFFTIVLMLAIGYAYLREGVFTSFCTFFNVFLAGLITFNFYEPLADQLEPAFPAYEKTSLPPPFFWGYEDFICMVVLFVASLALLRWLTNSLAPTEVQHLGWLRSGGAVVGGMATGYLLSGILICVLQTLPWHQEFMLFNPKFEHPGGIRAVLPPDRVWLATVHRAGAYAFANFEDDNARDDQPADERYPTFDRNGSWEFRYARFRRFDDNSMPRPYAGESEADRDDKLAKPD